MTFAAWRRRSIGPPARDRAAPWRSSPAPRRAERLARDYLSVSQATRPFAVFPRSEEARRWIDGLLAPAYGGNAAARVQAKREQAASVRAIARTMSLKADQLELERQADAIEAEADALESRR
jgi:hypothetical protein